MEHFGDQNCIQHKKATEIDYFFWDLKRQLFF